MLRGFRWQLIALVITGILFGVSILTRLSPSPQPTPTATVMVSDVTQGVPSTPTTAPTTMPVPTQLPDNVISSATASEIPTYREALIGQLQRLNPLLAEVNPVDRDITSLIFEGLTRINEFGEPVGALARSWVVTNDGLEYVFILREDVLWQDGLPFTADDVVFTMSLLSSPDFPGAKEIGGFWRTVETQKLGDYLVRFRLTQPLASFLTNLTVGILPEHALRGTTAAQLATHRFNLTPIGTGPYQIEALRSADGVTINRVDLRVAPNYRQRPEGQAHPYAVSRISFYLYDTFENAVAAVQRGDVDGLAARSMNERQTLLNLPNIRIYTGIEPTVGVLIFKWDEGTDRRFFKEQRVRVALQTGLNRATPVETRLANKAIVANSPLLYNSWAYAEIAYPGFNPQGAIDSLHLANIVRPNGAPPAEGETPVPTNTPDPAAPVYGFSILVWDDPALVAIAQEYATQWALRDPNTGNNTLNVTVDAQPFDVYQTRIENGEFDTAIVELPLSADPDVFAYWHTAQYPDGKNYGGAADDRLSEILERARRETNGINRQALYRQFQQGFVERAVGLPLYYPLYTYAVNARFAGVQVGFMGSPADRFRTLSDWQIGG